MQQRKRDLARIERLLRQPQHHRRVFADRIQHHGPRKLRHRYGANVIPLDFLVTGREPLTDEYANMFWISGRKILEENPARVFPR